MEPPKSQILIVDDNPMDRLLLQGMCKKLKLKGIQEAEDGNVALAKIDRALEMGHPFDLVLVDWNMPSASGLRVLQHIRQHPRMKTTKVVLVTGHSDQEKVEEALALQVDDFIVKPVDFEVLSAKLVKLGFGTF